MEAGTGTPRALRLRGQRDTLEVDLGVTRFPVESRWGIEPVFKGLGTNVRW
jgi:hypothetical protein